MILRTAISIIGLAALGYWAIITNDLQQRSKENELKTFTCQGIVQCKLLRSSYIALS
jgi:hypothetical protein